MWMPIKTFNKSITLVEKCLSIPLQPYYQILYNCIFVEFSLLKAEKGLNPHFPFKVFLFESISKRKTKAFEAIANTPTRVALLEWMAST